MVSPKSGLFLLLAMISFAMGMEKEEEKKEIITFFDIHKKKKEQHKYCTYISMCHAKRSEDKKNFEYSLLPLPYEKEEFSDLSLLTKYLHPEKNASNKIKIDKEILKKMINEIDQSFEKRSKFFNTKKPTDIFKPLDNLKYDNSWYASIQESQVMEKINAFNKKPDNVFSTLNIVFNKRYEKDKEYAQEEDKKFLDLLMGALELKSDGNSLKETINKDLSSSLLCFYLYLHPAKKGNGLTKKELSQALASLRHLRTKINGFEIVENYY
jgi:hypothetical protein